MKINREQVDTIFKNLKKLCLCRGCLFEDYLDVYHSQVTEVIDSQAKKIEQLEAENRHLQSHRQIDAIELSKLYDDEQVKKFLEAISHHKMCIDIPIAESEGEG
jgi:hypothetical protein